MISFIFLQSATPCDFGAPPGMEVPMRFGANLVNPNVPMTAGLAIVVEDVSLVYVSHSGIIEVVSYSRSTQTIIVTCSVYTVV